MSGGGGGTPWNVTQGNEEMGLLNTRWREAATNLRSIREKKKQKGRTAAELFRTSGSIESRDFVPEGFRSSAEILRQFDKDRAEAGQTQAGQLQSSPIGVQSEGELLMGKYGHIYGKDADLTPEQQRERDLLSRFRGGPTKGESSRIYTEFDEAGERKYKQRRIRLIGSGRNIIRKSRRLGVRRQGEGGTARAREGRAGGTSGFGP